MAGVTYMAWPWFQTGKHIYDQKPHTLKYTRIRKTKNFQRHKQITNNKTN